MSKRPWKATSVEPATEKSRRISVPKLEQERRVASRRILGPHPLPTVREPSWAAQIRSRGQMALQYNLLSRSRSRALGGFVRDDATPSPRTKSNRQTTYARMHESTEPRFDWTKYQITNERIRAKRRSRSSSIFANLRENCWTTSISYPPFKTKSKRAEN